jgi:hypothetical protein
MKQFLLLIMHIDLCTLAFLSPDRACTGSNNYTSPILKETYGLNDVECMSWCVENRFV